MRGRERDWKLKVWRQPSSNNNKQLRGGRHTKSNMAPEVGWQDSAGAFSAFTADTHNSTVKRLWTLPVHTAATRSLRVWLWVVFSWAMIRLAQVIACARDNRPLIFADESFPLVLFAIAKQVHRFFYFCHLLWANKPLKFQIQAQLYHCSTREQDSERSIWISSGPTSATGKQLANLLFIIISVVIILEQWSWTNDEREGLVTSYYPFIVLLAGWLGWKNW